MKNIPIARPREYLKRLVEKTESFLRRVRWKAHHFLKPATANPSTNKETFGFHTTISPPPIKELDEFEDKMLNIIQSIEFKSTDNSFQKELAQYLNKIKTDDKLLIAADKTTNFYRLDTPAYNKLLDNAITKVYKKAPPNTTRNLISEEKEITKNLGLDNRIDSLATKDSFITLKDHKPNFKNNPTCRLINPSKSEIGIISRQILQRINSEIAKSTRLNQWKNTNSLLEWFNALPNQPARSFISFDVVDFYPSISEDLLNEALEFASLYDNITEEEKTIIVQAKQSLLFNRDSVWCKRESSTLFDVTMGSFDGAETCELVGSFLLSKITPVCGNDIGLYRDDGLAAFKKSPREIEGIKKHICKVFSEHNFKLTIEANKECVNLI